MEKQENELFNIIINAGDARGKAYDALEQAEGGNFELSEKYLSEAKEKIKQAHNVQTDLLQKEADGDETELTMLGIHAQDHLMTAIAEKGLIENQIKMYKELFELKRKVEE